MTTIYGITPCNSVKKVCALLQTHQIAYDFVDFKKHAPSETQILTWLQHIDLAQLLNKRSTTWRKLSPEQQKEANTQAGAVSLMAAFPSLIKRPVLFHENRFYAGADDAIKAINHANPNAV